MPTDAADHRVDPTPCYISKSVVIDYRGNPPGQNGKGRVTLHSRTDPCGHVNEDAIPTFDVFVEEWAEQWSTTVRPCRVCGGSL